MSRFAGAGEIQGELRRHLPPCRRGRYKEVPAVPKSVRPMTYCCGILVRDGLVMFADTRTNAGVDNVSTFRKLHVFTQPGQRIMAIAAAGNCVPARWKPASRARCGPISPAKLKGPTRIVALAVSPHHGSG